MEILSIMLNLLYTSLLLIGIRNQSLSNTAVRFKDNGTGDLAPETVLSLEWSDSKERKEKQHL